MKINVPTIYERDTFCKIAISNANKTIPSGYCGKADENEGKNVQWVLNTENEELIISGTGKMADCTEAPPWYSYRSSIKTVTIENGVTSIGDRAFFYCIKLTSITIPSSVTSIVEYPFIGCYKLTSINVNQSNANYKTIDGVLFTKNEKTLVYYPAGNSRTSYNIPNYVTHIRALAFLYCNALTSVTIPPNFCYFYWIRCFFCL